MAPYLPLYISRSDGKLEVLTKSRKKELNKPTDEQLDNKPDAKGNKDCFKELELGDTKELDWRRKLGGMLIREIGGQDQGGSNYILAALPENYRLYERSKISSGGSEISDAYLYGHPHGRKKRYRSPGDFFPHLLWLATDESGDPDNCSCKFCAPDDLQIFEKPEKVKAPVPFKKDEPPKKDISTSKSTAIGTKPMVIVPPRSESQDRNIPITKPPLSKPAQSPTVGPAATRQSGPPQLTPTLLAKAKKFEQDEDAQWMRYIFRPGELAWFNRGNAWGLSVILKRKLVRDIQQHDHAKYLVQPLSHPFHHPQTKVIESEDGLRPWLAWSPPSPTHQGLAAAATGLTYSTVDWKGVLAGRYGQGDAEVDGSIFAAKAVDDSFSLFGPLANNTVTTGERVYNGLYLGGEKIWTGEPVRLRPGSGNDIMVVHSVVERLKQGSTSTATATVLLVGDIYKFTTMQLQPGVEPPDNRHLPIRLQQEMEYRNRATIPTKRTLSYWKIIQAQTPMSITDIKGRWYESSALLPILKGTAEFAKDVQRGEIGDAGQWMNARGDCNGLGNAIASRLGTRVFNRLEAFGKSIPANSRISMGYDGPPADQDFPTSEAEDAVPVGMQEQGEAMQGVEEEGKNGEGVSDDIAQFVDLDSMEEGYVQNYVEGGGQY